MAKTVSYAKIYRLIIDVLERGRLDRRSLISSVVSRFGLTKEECEDCSAFGVKNNLRSKVGSVLNDMEARELISFDSDGLYYLISERPIIIRIEKCENEILKALSLSSMSKSEIRETLVRAFGTDKTASTKDDDTLFTFMGSILKKLESLGVIRQVDGIYSLSPRVSAKADDMNIFDFCLTGKLYAS